VPVTIGLLDGDGEVLRDSEVVLLDTPTKTVRWEGVASAPVISALRGFSAPVNLTTDTRPSTATCSSPPTRTCSTAGKPARPWPAS
jgi:aminopeptidase N